MMPTLFTSDTGAKVVIATQDHCPPHVHVIHKAEGWIVNMWFSFAETEIGIVGIVPTEGAVRQRQLNVLHAELTRNLLTCRAMWWAMQRKTCFEGQWVSLDPLNRPAFQAPWCLARTGSLPPPTIQPPTGLGFGFGAPRIWNLTPNRRQCHERQRHNGSRPCPRGRSRP